MDKRSIRIGNWVCDASNYNYELRVGINELEYANIFVPVKIAPRFLSIFREDDIAGVYYKEENGAIVSIQKEGEGLWRLSIHTSSSKFEGYIRYVHELQNLLWDCGFKWDICV